MKALLNKIQVLSTAVAILIGWVLLFAGILNLLSQAGSPAGLLVVIIELAVISFEVKYIITGMINENL